MRTAFVSIASSVVTTVVLLAAVAFAQSAAYDSVRVLNLKSDDVLHTIGGFGNTPTNVSGGGEIFLDGNVEIAGSAYLEGGIMATSSNALGFEVGTGQAFRIASDSTVEALDFTDNGTQPTCDATHRGWAWFDEGGAGVKDAFEICAKDAGNAYAWRTIY